MEKLQNGSPHLPPRIETRKWFGFKLKIILLGLLLVNLFGINTASGVWNWDPTTGIFNFKVDRNTKKAMFSMLVYRDVASSTNDNNLLFAEVEINGKVYFEMYSQSFYNAYKTDDYYHVANYPGAKYQITLYGNSEDTWKINNFTSTKTIETVLRKEGDFAYVDFTIELEDVDLYAPTYTLNIPRLWF